MLNRTQPRRQAGGDRPRRGQRGLDDARLVTAALAEMERAGVEDFSLRSAARAIGCDPAALIYRFGSREGLERAVADRLHEGIGRPDPSLPWRERLLTMARQYRAVAQAYPRTFPLLMRHWTTGPQDLALADATLAALAEAGLPDAVLPAVECGFYAALLGLCAGEVGGLVGRPGPATLKQIGAAAGLETIPRLLPVLRKTGADDIFEATMAVIMDGIAAQGQKRKPGRAKRVRLTAGKRRRA